MKQFFAVLAVAMVMASCGQAGNGTNTGTDSTAVDSTKVDSTVVVADSAAVSVTADSTSAK